MHAHSAIVEGGRELSLEMSIFSETGTGGDIQGALSWHCRDGALQRTLNMLCRRRVAFCSSSLWVRPVATVSLLVVLLHSRSLLILVNNSAVLADYLLELVLKRRERTFLKRSVLTRIAV